MFRGLPLLARQRGSGLARSMALVRFQATSSSPSSSSAPSFALTPQEHFLKLLKQCQSAKELEQLILTSPIECLDAENVTRATSGLGQLRSTNQRAIDKVLAAIQMPSTNASGQDSGFPPTFLTHLCHGISAGKLAEQMPAVLTQQVGRDLTVFSNDELFTLLYCFSSKEVDNAVLCEKFYDECNARNVREFEDADFGILLESFAKWRRALKGTELGAKLVEELQTRPLHGFATMELCIILERLEYKDPAFFEHFSKELAKRSDYDSLADNQYFDSDKLDEEMDGSGNKSVTSWDENGFPTIEVTEDDLKDADFDESEDVNFNDDKEEEDEEEEEERAVLSPKSKSRPSSSPSAKVEDDEDEDDAMPSSTQNEEPKQLKPNIRRFRRRMM